MRLWSPAAVIFVFIAKIVHSSQTVAKHDGSALVPVESPMASITEFDVKELEKISRSIYLMTQVHARFETPNLCFTSTIIAQIIEIIYPLLFERINHYYSPPITPRPDDKPGLKPVYHTILSIADNLSGIPAANLDLDDESAFQMIEIQLAANELAALINEDEFIESAISKALHSRLSTKRPSNDSYSFYLDLFLGYFSRPQTMQMQYTAEWIDRANSLLALRVSIDHSKGLMQIFLLATHKGKINVFEKLRVMLSETTDKVSQTFEKFLICDNQTIGVFRERYSGRRGPSPAQYDLGDILSISPRHYDALGEAIENIEGISSAERIIFNIIAEREYSGMRLTQAENDELSIKVTGFVSECQKSLESLQSVRIRWLKHVAEQSLDLAKLILDATDQSEREALDVDELAWHLGKSINATKADGYEHFSVTADLAGGRALYKHVKHLMRLRALYASGYLGLDADKLAESASLIYGQRDQFQEYPYLQDLVEEMWKCYSQKPAEVVNIHRAIIEHCLNLINRADEKDSFSGRNRRIFCDSTTENSLGTWVAVGRRLRTAIIALEGQLNILESISWDRLYKARARFMKKKTKFEACLRHPQECNTTDGLLQYYALTGAILYIIDSAIVRLPNQFEHSEVLLSVRYELNI